MDINGSPRLQSEPKEAIKMTGVEKSTLHNDKRLQIDETSFAVQMHTGGQASGAEVCVFLP